jgi:hypothetical protein
MAGTLFLGCLFVSGTALLVLACYFLMRRLTGEPPDAQTKELANSVVIRIATLHGLILALVFAQEMAEYQQLKLESAAEANALADIYFDAGRYGAVEPASITTPVREYVRIVIDEEWDSLGTAGRLASSAWAQWDTAYNAILDLTPTTERQRSLRDHMLASVHTIAATRVEREHHARNSLSVMFWFAAISGVIFTGLAYYAYTPERSNLRLLALLGAFTGIILFFIYAFSNPFKEPGSLEPSGFRHLSRQLQEAAGTPRR